ncbi:MAG: hypothetical protein M0Z99_25520 [Betaproteobacteria bacterium]|nr:hypothetical protein [Betaproteobacteria bacterium]
MAEDDEAHAVQQLRAPVDEDFAPAMRAQARPEFRRASGDHHAAFVELGQRIAQRAAFGTALAARVRERRKMAPVECRLGQRQGQPDQRIEQVMPVAGACRDFAGKESTLLVAVRTTEGLDKTQGDATAGDQLLLAGQGVEPSQVRRAAREPRSQKHR